MHEQRAKELLAARISHLESPSHKKAHLHMWTAVALCSAVFIGGYAFIVSKTYHIDAVKASIVQAVDQVKDVGATFEPVLNETKTMWNAVQGKVVKEAQAQVEGNVIQEMKKTIGAPDVPTPPQLPKAESKPKE